MCKAILARGVVQIFEADINVGMELLQAWGKILNVKEKERKQQYRSIEEYLVFRNIDSFTGFVILLAIWSIAYVSSK